MHYYQFNIGDYYSHTTHLQPFEDLAYRRIIDLYYLNERPLNGCPTTVAREIGLVQQGDAVSYVLERFFVQNDDLDWVHERIESDIVMYKAKHKQAKAAGKASAKARKNKTLEQPLNDRSTTVQPTNNHNPITINHKPLTNVKDPKTCQAGAMTVVKKSEVEQVFDYWVSVMGKSPQTVKVTPKRTKAINDRLKDGYELTTLLRAIDGCKLDDFSMGNNDRGKPFNDIELICRSGEKLESFYEMSKAEQKRPMSKISNTNFNNMKNINLDEL